LSGITTSSIAMLIIIENSLCFLQKNLSGKYKPNKGFSSLI